MSRTDPIPTQGQGQDFRYTHEDFLHIARIAHREFGISLPETKEMLVYSRLGKRLRARGLSDFKSYCALVESEAGAEERRKMISALTTNVTRFLREDHHFKYLADQVWPGLTARLRQGGRVRIWSAGCSTGEEVYTLAFSLLVPMPDAARCDLKILATDVDPEVLATARRGRYRKEAADGLPEWARRHLLPVEGSDDKVEVAEVVRQMIDFRELNLIRPLPMKGPFDVIFCRNVAIYFDDATQDQLWHAFAGVMAPGSHLFIGHSERLSPRIAARFSTTGMTSYRLLPTDMAVAPVPRRG